MFVVLRQSGKAKFAKFSECILDQLKAGPSSLRTAVQIREDVEKNELEIQLASNSSDRTDVVEMVVEHPSFCPMRVLRSSTSPEEWDKISFPFPKLNATVQMFQLEKMLRQRRSFEVSALVESSDGAVLLTRRSPQLRAFPGVWVPPGGYVDEGETLLEAGLREMAEETGLDIPAKDCGFKYLGIWESVYPATLEQGTPKRHCLVIYVLIRLPESSAQLTPKLRLSIDEVDLATWLDPVTAKAIVDGSETSHQSIRVMDCDGTEKDHPTRLLLQRLPIGDNSTPPMLERVSTGTRFALSLWLGRS